MHAPCIFGSKVKSGVGRLELGGTAVSHKESRKGVDKIRDGGQLRRTPLRQNTASFVNTVRSLTYLKLVLSEMLHKEKRNSW